jgi:hypothetical protein
MHLAPLQDILVYSALTLFGYGTVKFAGGWMGLFLKLGGKLGGDDVAEFDAELGARRVERSDDVEPGIKRRAEPGGVSGAVEINDSRFAQRRLASGNWASGTTRLTTPRDCAVAASIVSPKYKSSRAFL